jgi:hypothetical protein
MAGLRLALRPRLANKFTLVTLLLVLVLLVTCLGAASAAAQALATRRVGIQWEAGTPRVTFSARDLVNAAARRELESGLQKRILLTVQAFDARSLRPIATERVTCGATYDLWEESYIVRIGRRTERHPDIASVLTRCLVANRLRVGSAEAWQRYRGHRVFFAVRAEFNPISASRCSALLRPTSSDGPVGPIVVNIVRREICAAERAIDFRSPEVEAP